MACRSTRTPLRLVGQRAAHMASERHQPSILAAAAAGALAASSSPATTTATTTTTTNASSHHHGRRAFSSTPQHRMLDSLRENIGKAIRSGAQPYRIVHATESIYKACAKEAAYTIPAAQKQAGTIPKTPEGEDIGEGSTMWHKDFGLPPTFSTWSQVTMLHLYLIFARLRDLDLDSARSWQRQLVDHFFFDAEERMDVHHGIASRALRHRYLKDVFVQWRGAIAAYDEGVVKGDAVLAAAVWRNVYKGRPDVDARAVAAVVSWMRLTLKMLDQMPDEALYFSTQSAFKWPARNEFVVVDAPAPELKGFLDNSNDAPAPAAQPRPSPKR